jgi:hypothetical protein
MTDKDVEILNKEQPEEPKKSSIEEAKENHKMRQISLLQVQKGTKILSIMYIAIEILLMIYIIFFFYSMFTINYPIAFMCALTLIGAKTVTAFFSFKMSIKKEEDWKTGDLAQYESVWWYMSRWFYLFIVVQTVASILLIVLFPLVMSDLAMNYSSHMLIIFGVDTIVYLIYASFTIVYLSYRIKMENEKIYNI